MIAGAVIFDALKSPSYFPGTCLTSCRRPSLARPCGAFFYGAGAWPTCPSGGGSWSPSPGSWPPTPSSRNSCQEKPEWRSVPFQLVFVARRSKTHLRVIRVIRVISRQRAKKTFCVRASCNILHPWVKIWPQKQQQCLACSETILVSARNAFSSFPFSRWEFFFVQRRFSLGPVPVFGSYCSPLTLCTHFQIVAKLQFNARMSHCCSDSCHGAKFVSCMLYEMTYTIWSVLHLLLCPCLSCATPFAPRNISRHLPKFSTFYEMDPILFPKFRSKSRNLCRLICASRQSDCSVL